MNDLQQLAHIFEMQTRGRFVKEVESAPGLSFGKPFGKLHALCFTARKRSCGLPKLNVSSTDVSQCLQLLPYLRNIFQDWKSVRDGSLQQIGNRFAFESHRQRFMVITMSAANLAQDINVRHKIHFNAALAFALAMLAAPAGDVKRKTP